MRALRIHLHARAREESGFGMIELLCAMAVLSIGVMAVFVMFQSGAVQIKRASNVGTSAAIADSEMEKFRAVRYNTIGLATVDLDTADSTYTGDTAFRAVSDPENQTNSTVTMAKCPADPCTDKVPTKTVTGPDGKSYRVDTFITWQTVTSSSGTAGRDVKLVTIVVRDSTKPQTYARVASSFDAATGS
jgi:prepilin-type N-terminal cleavage/methylation domain-containing protein